MLQLVYVTLFIHTVFAGRKPCVTPPGDTGFVVPLAECEPLDKLSKLETKFDEDLIFIQQSIYEITEDYQINVCCPPKNEWNNPFYFNAIIYPEPDPFKMKYEAGVDVPSTNQLYFDEKIRNCSQTILPPDPDTLCCGVSQFDIANTAQGLVYDSGFPWVVLLEYADGRQVCGGSLISARFILTAAHCIGTEYGDPELAHLGSYDRSKPNKTEETASIPIERIIVHPLYNRTMHIHDIALLKLIDFTPFSYLMSPICLPTHDVTTTGLPYPHNFAVAGWGLTESGNVADRKLFAPVPYSPLEECKKYHKYDLIPEQICAGGGTGDSCGGDSGGPLEMAEVDLQMYSIAGVVSYGSKHCADLGNPSVYTHVFKYKDWIYKVIRSEL